MLALGCVLQVWLVLSTEAFQQLELERMAQLFPLLLLVDKSVLSLPLESVLAAPAERLLALGSMGFEGPSVVLVPQLVPLLEVVVALP